MKRLLLALLTGFVVNITSAQTFNQFYADVVSNTSQANVLNDLTAFESFGVKTVGSPALTTTENWITSRYQALGYTDVELQPFTYFAGTSIILLSLKREPYFQIRF